MAFGAKRHRVAFEIASAIALVASTFTCAARAQPTAPSTPSGGSEPSPGTSSAAPNSEPGVLMQPAPPAAAAPPPPQSQRPAELPLDPTMRKVVSERRNGVVLGFQTGVGFAGSSGYPNSARLIGNPDYYSSTPMLVGQSSTIFMMGALTDWLSFGPMLSWANFENEKWRSTGFGIGFRLESYPLYALVPALADTSLYTQLGIGSTQLRAKGDFPDADGTQTFVGVGLHHEFRLVRFLGGHLAAGPQVEYDVITSQAVERHWLTLGLRVAWYGGTVKADAR